MQGPKTLGEGGTESRNPEKVESAGLRAYSDEEPGEREESQITGTAE